MATKGPKAKAKPAPEPRSVLGTLPATRPERLGAPRKTARANGTPAKPAAARPRQGPTAVTPGSPPLRSHQRPTDARPVEPPRGTELVTTAIRATGELAQLGFSYGGHLLKRAVDRIPRP